jgi:magnesium chelatase family protein
MAAEKLSLSARGYHRVIKVARTIADLDSSPCIAAAHLAEALRYRPVTPTGKAAACSPFSTSSSPQKK